MSTIKRRLERAEQRFVERKPLQLSPLALEVRATDEEMRKLEREIAEARASMSPEEIQRADAEYRKSCDALLKLPFVEAIALLEAEIAELEAEIVEAEAQEEGGG